MVDAITDVATIGADACIVQASGNASCIDASVHVRINGTACHNACCASRGLGSHVNGVVTVLYHGCLRGYAHNTTHIQAYIITIILIYNIIYHAAGCLAIVDSAAAQDSAHNAAEFDVLNIHI